MPAPASVAVASGTAMNTAEPSGSAADHVILDMSSCEDNTSAAYTPSTSFTTFESANGNVGGSDLGCAVSWWRRAGSAAATNNSWSGSPGGQRTSRIAISGAKLTGSPIHDSTILSGTDTSAESTAITTTVNNCLILGFIIVYNWASSSISAGYTSELLDQGEAHSIYSYVQKVAGTTPTLTVTCGADWYHVLVAIEPEDPTNPPVAWFATGAKSSGGTTTISVASPAGTAADQLLINFRSAWRSTGECDPDDETDWTPGPELFGGTGTAADNHTTGIRGDHRILTGSLAGPTTFDQSGTASTNGGAVGIMASYELGDPSGTDWDIATGSGDDATHGTNRSVTCSSSLSLAVGDVVVVGVATDTDTSLAGFSSPAITASGITFGTTTRLTSGAGVTTGLDGNVEVFEATVTSGSGTQAPTIAFTTSTSQCGPAAFYRLRAVSSGTDGTATPAAIAIAITLPAPTPQASSTAAPAATAVPITLPAATPLASSTVAPAATSVPVTLPAPTPQGGGGRAPDAIAVPVTLPAVTPLASSIVAPSAIAIPITLPAVTASGGTAGTATPAAISVPITLPAPTPQASSIAAPAATSVIITLPAVTASGGGAGTATPAAITTTITLPAPTPQAGQTALPAAISIPVTIPQVTPTVGDSGAPSAITIPVTLPAVTASGGTAGTATPAAITVPITLPAPTVRFGATVSPAAIQIAITLGAAIATGIVPDTTPITLTLRDSGHTITIRDHGHTITIHDTDSTVTAREQQ